MAQTIAMQRGSTSVTANNTRYTLFTQSGGNATRVIINSVSIWSGSSSGGYFNIMLQVNNTGTSIYLPIAIKMTGGSSGSSAATFIPDTVGQVTSQRSSSSATISGQAIWVPDGNNWPSANGMNIYGGDTTATQSNSNAVFENCPRNFWIGPGDSVTFQAQTQTSGMSCTLGWSFTTITES